MVLSMLVRSAACVVSRASLEQHTFISSNHFSFRLVTCSESLLWVSSCQRSRKAQLTDVRGEAEKKIN